MLLNLWGNPMQIFIVFKEPDKNLLGPESDSVPRWSFMDENQYPGV